MSEMPEVQETIEQIEHETITHAFYLLPVERWAELADRLPNPPPPEMASIIVAENKETGLFDGYAIIAAVFHFECAADDSVDPVGFHTLLGSFLPKGTVYCAVVPDNPQGMVSANRHGMERVDGHLLFTKEVQ
jgi:hypothetical protein